MAEPKKVLMNEELIRMQRAQTRALQSISKNLAWLTVGVLFFLFGPAVIAFVIASLVLLGILAT